MAALELELIVWTRLHWYVFLMIQWRNRVQSCLRYCCRHCRRCRRRCRRQRVLFWKSLIDWLGPCIPVDSGTRMRLCDVTRVARRQIFSSAPVCLGPCRCIRPADLLFLRQIPWLSHENRELGRLHSNSSQILLLLTWIFQRTIHVPAN